MSKTVDYLKSNVIKKNHGGKEVQKICPECDHRWKGFPNSRCPECGYHPGKK